MALSLSFKVRTISILKLIPATTSFFKGESGEVESVCHIFTFVSSEPDATKDWFAPPKLEYIV